MNRLVSLSLLLAACGEGGSEDREPYRAAAIVGVSSDGMSGAVALIDIETFEAEQVEVASGDAIGRVWFDRYYVVNRGNDSVQVHDPADRATLIKEFSVGTTTDGAQDICCVSRDKCYVPRLSSPDLLIVNPEAEAGEETIGTIDLSELTTDGLPNPNACHVAGDKVVLSIGNLDDADPYLTALDPGLLAVIDTATDELSDSFETTVHNPFAGFVPQDENVALVGEVGAWSALDGGWEKIDLATGESLGMAVTEKALGGDVGRLAVCSTGEAYAIAQVCDADFNCTTPLVRVDLETGKVGPTVFDPEAYVLTWVAADDRGRLWVADSRTDGSPTGIWVYHCDGTRITKTPIDIGLPPAFEGVIQFL